MFNFNNVVMNNTFTIPSFIGKSILRSTEEEVEIIDFYLPNRGMRTNAKDLTFEEGDWVTYIDSEGKEHIREPLNIQLDFKPIADYTFNKVFDFATNQMPTTRNSRIYEVAKELVVKLQCNVEKAVKTATELVDIVGIETN